MQHVTRTVCRDCPYRGGSTKIDPRRFKQVESLAVLGEHVLECTTITLARSQGKVYPHPVCCYGYLYQHWTEIPTLRKAIEERQIEYVDIADLPILSESNFHAIPDVSGYSVTGFKEEVW